MFRFWNSLRRTFEPTSRSFRRSVDEIITPFMHEHGFSEEKFNDHYNLGSVIYRRGEQWIDLWVSKHPSDSPGDAGIKFGVGSSDWAEWDRAVPLTAYIDAKTIGAPSFSGADGVAATVAMMRKDLERYASDFLAGDLHIYQVAKAQRRSR